MKILSVHNAYQHRGGEDVAREAETRLLQQAGHEVVEYMRSNIGLSDASILRRVSLATETVWSSRTSRELGAFLLREKPDVAHFHNTVPLISPSAYYACAEAGVPVVQTLHNYRLLCPGANLLRDGRVCEECLGKSLAWPGILHGCYRDSHLATAAVAAMLAGHRAMGTWLEKIDVYVALTEFARRKFIEGGLPGDRISVKTNFVECDPGPKQCPGGYALYVGRLSEEKGLRVLLAAWARIRGDIQLKVAGDGPLREEIASIILRQRLGTVELLGHLSPQEIRSLMQGAYSLVFPSICFENFPLAIAEAFACGLPVIAPNQGAMAEIVADGATGLHFIPADPEELAGKVEWAWMHPQEMAAMGRAARAEFESKYTAAAALKQLENLYKSVLQNRRPPRSRPDLWYQQKSSLAPTAGKEPTECKPS
ncbi:MAG TPA: glycosyltransferase [Candidatus Acidoferrum sp.]|nr:glycosyltransferase [Candidatus Acidoferrum sp.]